MRILRLAALAQNDRGFRGVRRWDGGLQSLRHGLRRATSLYTREALGAVEGWGYNPSVMASPCHH